MRKHVAADADYLGVRFVVDNNFFPLSRSRERVELMALHKAGRILLAVVDVTGTEWLDAPPDVREVLEAEAGGATRVSRSPRSRPLAAGSRRARIRVGQSIPR